MDTTTEFVKYSEYLKRNVYFKLYPDGSLSCIECKRPLEHRFKFENYDVNLIMKVGCPICDIDLLADSIGSMNIGVVSRGAKTPVKDPTLRKVFKTEDIKPKVLFPNEPEQIIESDSDEELETEIEKTDELTQTVIINKMLETFNDRIESSIINYKRKRNNEKTIEVKEVHFPISEIEKNIIVSQGNRNIVKLNSTSDIVMNLIPILDSNPIITYDFFSMLQNDILLPDRDLKYNISEDKQLELQLLRNINDTTTLLGFDLLSKNIEELSEDKKYILTLGMCFSSLNFVLKNNKMDSDIINKISYPDIFLYAIRLRPESRFIKFDFNQYEIDKIQNLLKDLFKDKYNTNYTHKYHIVELVNTICNWIMYCALWKRNISILDRSRNNKVFWTYNYKYVGSVEGIYYYNLIKGLNKIEYFMDKDFKGNSSSLAYINWTKPIQTRQPQERIINKNEIKIAERYMSESYYLRSNESLSEYIESFFLLHVGKDVDKVMKSIYKSLETIHSKYIQMRRTIIEGFKPNSKLIENLFTHVEGRPVVFHMISSFLRLDNELSIYQGGIGIEISKGISSKQELLKRYIDILIGKNLDLINFENEYNSFIEKAKGVLNIDRYNNIISSCREMISKKSDDLLKFQGENEFNTLISFLETYNLNIDILNILNLIPNLKISELPEIDEFRILDSFGNETLLVDFLNNEFNFESIYLYETYFDVYNSSGKGIYKKYHPYYDIKLYKYINIRYGEIVADKIITLLYYSLCYPFKSSPEVFNNIFNLIHNAAVNIEDPPKIEEVPEELRNKLYNETYTFLKEKRSTYYKSFFNNLSRQLLDESITVDKAIENSEIITNNSIEREILLNNEILKFNFVNELKQ